ncbi:uncharacterized protein LOC133034220 [Cannabis sativa]|uniref:uncharacterized protein LOC133034220 n=1 Tax=Cannabis sativa TaxID=3483 RepID=UPI0029CA2F62|nr:uncharacterized protein LOC133034220 [Cannabis sativa]
MGDLYTSLFQGCCFTNNNPWLDKGRIIVDWQPNVYSVDIGLCTSQLIHCTVIPKQRVGKFQVTCVYGFNDEKRREELWTELEGLATNIAEPWLVWGDFNEILFANERIGRRAHVVPSQRFKDCISQCNLEDLKYSGAFLTWNNKQKPEERIYSKIDRAMINPCWMNFFSSSEAVFLPELSFDHSPILVSIYKDCNTGKKPFRYFNMWKLAPQFENLVADSWHPGIMGSRMYQVVSKLRRLKDVLRKLNKEGFSEIHKEDIAARLALADIQTRLNKDPMNMDLIEEEHRAHQHYIEVHKAYSLFITQKAKLNWAKYGDENSAMFHASLKARRIQN